MGMEASWVLVVTVLSGVGQPLATINVPYATVFECTDAQNHLSWYERTKRWPNFEVDCIPRLTKPDTQ